MNSHNQSKRGSTITRYKDTRKDTYNLLLNKFVDNVKESIFNILISERGMSEPKSRTTLKGLFNIDYKRKDEIIDDIEQDYISGKSKKKCAKNILNKYYKILLINNDKNDEIEDNVEVHESLKGKLKGKSESEIIKIIEERSTNLVEQLFSYAKYGIMDRFREEVEKTSNQMTLDKLLVKCASLSNVNVVKILIDNGAKIIEEDGKPNTLEIALQEDNYDVFKYLIENTNNNDFNDDGNKTLSNCVFYNRFNYVELLLNKFNYSLSIIEWMIKHAKSFGYRNIVKLLKEYKDKHYPSKLKRFKNYIGMNESNEYKQVSKSFLWSFMNRMENLGIKFIFDTTYIKGVPNSLNNPNYELFLKTDNIDKRYVIDEFKYSELMSNIINYIKDVDYIKFYIGVKTDSIHFGFMVDGKLYKIGYNKYSTNDLNKIIKFINKTDKTINLFNLFKRIKSKLRTTRYVSKILNKYLSNYEHIKIYKHIIDNNFMFVIESLNSDIININYLNKILLDKQLKYINFEISKGYKNNKYFYYITVL